MVAKSNETLIRGSKIDYFESLQRSGFKLENPNVRSDSCGCGGH
jgi:Fe-S cluster assembly iron-binding protein IscA